MAITEPKEWFDRELPEKVAKDPSVTGGFEGVLGFNIAGDKGGDWTVEIKGTQVTVRQGTDESAGFKIKIKDENFVKLINGELSGQRAFMSGKLKFKGNIPAAMKLRGLLFKP